MKIIGVDTGRQHTGIVVLDLSTMRLEDHVTCSISLKESRRSSAFNAGANRLNMLREFMAVYLKRLEGEDALACVEQYIWGSRFKVPREKDLGSLTPVEYRHHMNMLREIAHTDRDPMQVAEIHGAVSTVFSQLRIPMIKPTPSEVKFLTVGYGHADKRAMIRGIHSLYGVSLDDEHQYDALAVAHVGRLFISFCLAPAKFKRAFPREYLNCEAIATKYPDVLEYIRAAAVRQRNS